MINIYAGAYPLWMPNRPQHYVHALPLLKVDCSITVYWSTHKNWLIY